MNALQTITECEMDSIHLYCQDNSWKAFGHSAYYLTLLFPELEVTKKEMQDLTKISVCISDDCLMKIFHAPLLAVGDEYIEMAIPENVYCNEEYMQWCES